jgi:hypothetical protein
MDIDQEVTLSLLKLNILDEDNFYAGDFVVGVSGDMPQNWTSDLVGDGYYKAQYQGATRNPDTGEWTGGHWVETGGPSHEDLVAQATTTRAILMAEAADAISLLTDATDPDVMGDDIRPEDVALLKAWKAYRVQLSRIKPDDAPNITWPVKPASPLARF